MYAERIRDIVRKLAAARATAGLQARFGVEKHHFELRTPLAEAEVAAFERKHGIALPEDYRAFLIEGGNGGAGPYYGINELTDYAQWYEEEAEAPNFLSSPCPLVDGEPLRRAWKAAQARDERRRQGIVTAGAPPNAAWRGFLADQWEEWGKGSMEISDQGCTYSARLIVTGAARGRIVYLDAQGWYPPYFVKDASFLEWYERWLDNALAGGPDGFFGFDNPLY